MLARVFLPAFALQLAFLTFGFALSTYSEWLDGRYVANLSDRSGKDIGDIAGFFWLLGLGGTLIFMPLHWLVLGSARKLGVPAARLYLMAAFLMGMLWFVPSGSEWTLGIAVFFAPCLLFLSLASWAADAWCRRQEMAEQRTTDAFVLSRKQKIQRSTKP